jgi:hypothetical protein
MYLFRATASRYAVGWTKIVSRACPGPGDYLLIRKQELVGWDKSEDETDQQVK